MKFEIRTQFGNEEIDIQTNDEWHFAAYYKGKRITHYLLNVKQAFAKASEYLDNQNYATTLF